MPRNRSHVVLGSIVAGATLLGLTTFAPARASAAPVRAATPAAAVHPEWGSTSAKSARVKRGCHSYAYSYALTPPSGDWALETFLVGPRGKGAGSGYFITGKDELTGTSAWRLCWHTVKSGRYTIKALLSVQNGSELVEGWLPNSTFRLRKP